MIIKISNTFYFFSFAGKQQVHFLKVGISCILREGDELLARVPSLRMKDKDLCD